jgi:hypothetical protein
MMKDHPSGLRRLLEKDYDIYVAETVLARSASSSAKRSIFAPRRRRWNATDLSRAKDAADAHPHHDDGLDVGAKLQRC